MPTATPNWPGSTPRQAVDCCIFDQLDVLVVGFSRKSVRSPVSLPTPMSVARVAIGLVVILGIVAYSSYSVITTCLLYTSPSPRDLSTSRMPSSA